MAEKTLITLSKIHKQQTDLLRREMVALETERHQLETLSGKLQDEHKQEMQMVITQPSFGRFFGSYSSSVKRKLHNISEEIKRLSELIDAKRTLVMEEFSEQKKYEIAQENARKRMTEEEKHRLQSRFDEVATQKYVRSENA
jgi:hypothetical protein